jgi:DNA-binding winged helix-turn-helix (wHTH) protein
MRKQQDDTAIYEFGPFRLEAVELLYNGTAMPLEPKDFQLLRVLARNSGKVVTYEQLLDEIWEGVNVELGNLYARVSRLNKTLIDKDGDGSYINNFPKVGYRFSHTVTRIPDEKFLVVDRPVLAHLTAARETFKTEGAPFRISNVLLALLDLPGGMTGRMFDSIRSGLSSSLAQELRSFIRETQIPTDRERGRPYTAVDWHQQQFVQIAAQEASRENCPVVIEKHLLLGVLQSTSSNTIKWLRALLGNGDFDRLIEQTRADGGTPISGRTRLMNKPPRRGGSH